MDSGRQPDGVSFVVPVRDGARTLEAVLAAILAQDDGRPFEVIAVDDGSADDSPAILARFARDPRVRVLTGERRGAAAAINLGVRRAAHAVIAQVDQDVVLQPGWLARLLPQLAPPEVAAVQGRYVPDRADRVLARIAALDLALRYDRLPEGSTDHVCTGNSVYRREALVRVGLLDEGLSYGYDNDLSYRLTRAGYRLVFCPRATSIHHGRVTCLAYLRQQYGLGYGRLDVVWRHPHRVLGDRVSGPLMMLHAPLALVALLGAAGAGLAAAIGGPWDSLLLAAGAVTLLLAVERGAAGATALWRYRDPAGLLFVPVHLARDGAWAAAIAVWALRRLARRPARGGQSLAAMGRPSGRPQESGSTAPDRLGGLEQSWVVLVPAFNEAANLPWVVAEVRRLTPASDVLVVDDGSTDETAAVVERLGARYLRFRSRLGVGGAVRAGLRYARQLGYDIVVRVDGDGQHAAADIVRVAEPVVVGRADAAIGVRPTGPAAGVRAALRGASMRLLARCLSVLTGQRVTDPTSGFWAFGPRAVALLATHHPGGYSEPELRLLLARNGLRIEEVLVGMRPRMGGRTSLTPGRTGHALARTLLALVVVPLRGRLERPADD